MAYGYGGLPDPIMSAINAYGAVASIQQQQREAERQAKRDALYEEQTRLNMDATRKSMERQDQEWNDRVIEKEATARFLMAKSLPEVAEIIKNTKDGELFMSDPDALQAQLAKYKTVRGAIPKVLSGGASLDELYPLINELPEVQRRLTLDGKREGQIVKVSADPSGKGLVITGRFREPFKDANGEPLRNPDGTIQMREWEAPLTKGASSDPGAEVNIYSIEGILGGIDRNIAVLEKMAQFQPQYAALMAGSQVAQQSALADIAERKSKDRSAAISKAVLTEKDPRKQGMAAIQAGAEPQEAKALFEIANPKPEWEDAGYGRKIDRYGVIHNVPVAPRSSGGGGGGGGASAIKMMNAMKKPYQDQIKKAADNYNKLLKELTAYSGKQSSGPPSEMEAMFGSKGAKFNRGTYDEMRRQVNEARRVYESMTQDYYQGFGEVYSPLTGFGTRQPAQQQAAPPANSGRAIAEHKPQSQKQSSSPKGYIYQNGQLVPKG